MSADELSAQPVSADELSAQSSGDLSTQPLSDKLINTHIQVPVPKIVQVYNRHIGSVDLFDSLVGLYRTRIRSKKWYHSIFSHLVDLAVDIGQLTSAIEG